MALAASCSPVVVVVGANEEKIRAELAGLAIEIISNENWREGIASSVRAGVEHAMKSDAVIFLTCDQPVVRPKTLADLIELHRTSGRPIVASAYASTLGIPALFDRVCFPDLLALHGDHGAKRIILSRRDEVATYDFPEGAVDIDQPSDLRLLPAEEFPEGIEDTIR